MNKKLLVIMLAVTFTVLLTSCSSASVTTTDSAINHELAENISKDESKPSGSVASEKQVSESSESAESLSWFEKMFENPHPAYDENDKGGYIDINGNWVISPQYRRVYPFSEGLAVVQDATTEKWGYINLNGDVVVEPKFSRAGIFMDGKAVVSESGYKDFGMIDTKGNYLFEPIYKELSYFKDGYALVQERDSNMYRYINENYEFVFGEYNEAYLFHDGRAVVASYGAHSGGWYMLDEDGKLSEFSVDIDEFPSNRIYGDGHSIGYIDLEEGQVVKTTSDQFVMIDESGNAISPYFDSLSGFSEDYAQAGRYVDGKLLYGFVDKDFNWVIEPQYDQVGNFIDGYAYAIKYKEIDYDNYDAEYEREHICDNWVLIDKNGNEILDAAEHNGISMSPIAFSGARDGIPLPARKKISDNSGDVIWGYADWNYNEVIPFKFEVIDSFAYDGSYAIVRYNGYYGIIDKEGNWLIEAKFSSLETDRS